MFFTDFFHCWQVVSGPMDAFVAFLCESMADQMQKLVLFVTNSTNYIVTAVITYIAFSINYMKTIFTMNVIWCLRWIILEKRWYLGLEHFPKESCQRMRVADVFWAITLFTQRSWSEHIGVILKPVASKAFIFGTWAQKTVDVIIKTDPFWSIPSMSCILERRSRRMIWNRTLAIPNNFLKVVRSLISELECEIRETHLYLLSILIIDSYTS